MVAEADNGQKKYYLTKKADGAEWRPSRGGAVPSASNNIIAEQKVNFSPSKILDNKTFQSGFQNVSSKGATISALNYFENDEDKWTEEKHKNFLKALLQIGLETLKNTLFMAQKKTTGQINLI